METVLVTGGAGFIGAHLVDRLINEGNKVVIVDNLKTIGGIPYVNPKADFFKGDICENELYSKLEKYQFDTIYHLAAQSAGESSYDNPQYDLLSNSFGTYQVALFAKKTGVKRFIYTSTVAVYGKSAAGHTEETAEIRPDSIYGVSKFSGELFVRQLLEDTDCKYTMFRVFNAYGPGENLNYLKKGMVSIYASFIWRGESVQVKGSLDRYRDYTYIDDCIDALLMCRDNSNSFSQVYNLSSGVKTIVRDLINEMIDVAGKGKGYPVVELGGTPGDTFGFHASVEKLEKDLGWKPKVGLREGLEKYFAWINKVPVQDSITDFHPLNM